MITQEDLKDVILNFLPDDEVRPDHRYSSFDYCFHWFQTHKTKIADEDKIEQSCLHLMCYMASWGMLRGSSILLQKSAKFYEPLIKLIAGKQVGQIEGINQCIWSIDVDEYCKNFQQCGSADTQKGSEIILDTYNKIKECLYPANSNSNPSVTAITKIMLGVFRCVPAIDRYFRQTFSQLYPNQGFAQPQQLTETHLACILGFYQDHKSFIQELSSCIKVLNFDNTESCHCYTSAKIIDMYGFNKSFVS